MPPTDELDERLRSATRAWTTDISFREPTGLRDDLDRAGASRRRFTSLMAVLVVLLGSVLTWLVIDRTGSRAVDVAQAPPTMSGAVSTTTDADPLDSMRPDAEFSGLSPELVTAVEHRGGVVRAPSLPGFAPWRFELSCDPHDDALGQTTSCTIIFVLRRDLGGRQDIIRLCSRTADSALCAPDDRVAPRRMPDGSELVVTDIDSAIDPAIVDSATTADDLGPWQQVGGTFT